MARYINVHQHPSGSGIHWAGDGRIDAAYENGGRLRNFVLVWPQGETEYIAGQIRQK